MTFGCFMCIGSFTSSIKRDNFVTKYIWSLQISQFDIKGGNGLLMPFYLELKQHNRLGTLSLSLSLMFSHLSF